MPPRKRKVPQPLAVYFAAPISGVVAVRGCGVYDEAKKRFLFNAQLFEQDNAPVYVTGQKRARLTLHVPESDANDPAKVTSIVRRFVEGAFRAPVEASQGGAAGPSPAEPSLAAFTPQEITAVREDRFTAAYRGPDGRRGPLLARQAEHAQLPDRIGVHLCWRRH